MGGEWAGSGPAVEAGSYLAASQLGCVHGIGNSTGVGHGVVSVMEWCRPWSGVGHGLLSVMGGGIVPINTGIHPRLGAGTGQGRQGHGFTGAEPNPDLAASLNSNPNTRVKFTDASAMAR